MEALVTRAEFEQHTLRMEDEHRRQNRRIELLEEESQQIHSLATSVEKLAISIDTMVKTQEAQGERLEKLESRDGEMWRKVVGYAITCVISLVLGFVFSKLGM